MSVANVKHPDHEPAQVEVAILEAARDILATRGVDGLSMRQVADQVGVSATAIYHYFDGKQDLVNRVVLSAFDRFGAYLNAAMAEQPRGSMERIVALGEGYIKFALENQAYFRVMFSIAPEDRVALTELPDEGGYHLLRTAVVDAVEAETIRGSDDEVQSALAEVGVPARAHSDVVSMFLWSMAHGLVTLALCGAAEHCRIEGAASAADLLRAFRPLLRTGITGQRDQSGATKNEIRDEE